MQVAHKGSQHARLQFHEAIVGRGLGEIVSEAAFQDLIAVEVLEALMPTQVVEHFNAHHLTCGQARLIRGMGAAWSREQVRLELFFKSDAEIVHLTEHLH